MLNDAPLGGRRQQDGSAGVRALDDAAIMRCFEGLEGAGPILLAVSGGPDSVALMLMAARWASQCHEARHLHVATVDHGLRAASRQEAEAVRRAAAALGLPHAILPWRGSKPSSRVQERARAARYALLADHARAIGADVVCTGHHADDQAETVLFRLGRGSGIGGLAGMRRRVALVDGISLVRPLLDLMKRELVAHCRAEAHPFSEDPSNGDPRFARTRLRADVPALQAIGLEGPVLIRLARRMARADAALEAEVDRVEELLGADHAIGHARLDLSRTSGVAEEVRLRLLRRAVAHVAGPAPIRLERLERLTNALWASLAARRGYRATLAGAKIVLAPDGVLTISPEAERRRGLATPSHSPRLRPI